jgi:hypothetical protein
VTAHLQEKRRIHFNVSRVEVICIPQMQTKSMHKESKKPPNYTSRARYLGHNSSN